MAVAAQAQAIQALAALLGVQRREPAVCWCGCWCWPLATSAPLFADAPVFVPGTGMAAESGAAEKHKEANLKRTEGSRDTTDVRGSVKPSESMAEGYEANGFPAVAAGRCPQKDVLRMRTCELANVVVKNRYSPLEDEAPASDGCCGMHSMPEPEPQCLPRPVALGRKVSPAARPSLAATAAVVATGTDHAAGKQNVQSAADTLAHAASVAIGEGDDDLLLAFGTMSFAKQGFGIFAGASQAPPGRHCRRQARQRRAVASMPVRAAQHMVDGEEELTRERPMAELKAGISPMLLEYMAKQCEESTAITANLLACWYIEHVCSMEVDYIQTESDFIALKVLILSTIESSLSTRLREFSGCGRL